MSIEFTLDGKQVTAEEGQSLPEVAAANGIYLPTLCYHPEQERVGTCRVCQVRFNGSIVAGCTVRLWDGASVEIDAPDLMAMRREVVDSFPPLRSDWHRFLLMIAAHNGYQTHIVGKIAGG